MSEPVQIAMLGSGFVAEFYMQGLANVNGQQVVAELLAHAEARESVCKALGNRRNRRRISIR